MKNRMTRIGDILGTALDDIRPSRDIGMCRIWDKWDQAVGSTIAAEAKPSAFNDGILIINVSSSVWMQQLNFLKRDMIRKINTVMECEMVREIRFKIARVHN